MSELNGPNGDNRKRRRTTVVRVKTTTATGSNELTRGSVPSQSGRFLTVPSSLNDFEEQVTSNDLYLNSNHWKSIWFDHVARPFPSTQLLTARQNTAHKKTSKTALPPILVDFYKALGQDNEDDKKQGNGTKDDNHQGGNISTQDENVQTTPRLRDQLPPENIPEPAVESIDDPALSTISRGKHKKYLELTSRQQTDRRTPKQRRELRLLTNAVVEEQQAYRKALAQFFELHSKRFLVGFQNSTVVNNAVTSTTAGLFVRIASYMSEVANRPYQNIISSSSSNGKDDELVPGGKMYCNRFGKCQQILSVQSPPATRLDSQKHPRPLLHVDSLKFEVVHKTEGTPCCITAEQFPSVPTTIPPPDKNRIPGRLLLQEDEIAKQLAAKYNVDVVTSAETLETMLKLPGEYGTQWMLYANATTVQVNKPNGRDNTKSRRLTILDLPIAQPHLSPRACLEIGYQEGIYQWLVNIASKETRNQSNSTTGTTGHVQHVYTLWKLPELSNAPTTTSSFRRNVVLVRSIVRLCYQEDHKPLRIRTNIEYFPERGQEISSSYDKALWILDQLLFATPSSDSSASSAKPFEAFSKIGRIDPRSSRLTDWQDTSIAHAFADGSDISTSTAGRHTDPMTHWHILVQLLHSVPTIDNSNGPNDSNYLLCLPGRGGQIPSPTLSVSVHAGETSQATKRISLSLPSEIEEDAAKTEATRDSIDLSIMIFPHANTVRLGADALMFGCPRDWQWQSDDRIPYTFPLPEQPLDSKETIMS